MKKILVIDDNRDIRESLQEILESNGYEVSTASDGHKGYIVFQETPSDLIITDILMPGKDGLEMILSIREENPDVHIIAISGGTTTGNGETYLRSSRDLGVAHTFTKPIDIKTLLKTVEELVGK